MTAHQLILFSQSASLSKTLQSKVDFHEDCDAAFLNRGDTYGRGRCYFTMERELCCNSWFVGAPESLLSVILYTLLSTTLCTCFIFALYTFTQDIVEPVRHCTIISPKPESKLKTPFRFPPLSTVHLLPPFNIPLPSLHLHNSSRVMKYQIF